MGGFFSRNSVSFHPFEGDFLKQYLQELLFESPRKITQESLDEFMTKKNAEDIALGISNGLSGQIPEGILEEDVPAWISEGRISEETVESFS